VNVAASNPIAVVTPSTGKISADCPGCRGGGQAGIAGVGEAAGDSPGRAPARAGGASFAVVGDSRLCGRLHWLHGGMGAPHRSAIIISDCPDKTTLLFRRPGNTIVIKPSEDMPLNASLFADIIANSGLPPGPVNVVHGRGASVGAALSGHPDVAMISFIGSVRAGSVVMTEVATNISKVSLELGGNGPPS